MYLFGNVHSSKIEIYKMEKIVAINIIAKSLPASLDTTTFEEMVRMNSICGVNEVC